MTSSDPAAILAFDGSQIDSSWYTGVTNFARATSWLNGAMDAYTSYGIALFVVFIMVAWWIARPRRYRHHDRGPGGARRGDLRVCGQRHHQGG